MSPEDEGITNFTQIKNPGWLRRNRSRCVYESRTTERVLISLFGGDGGTRRRVVTGQFYALSIMQTILKVNVKQANHYRGDCTALRDAVLTVRRALDKIGRKWFV